jgi:hypothetical protein
MSHAETKTHCLYVERRRSFKERILDCWSNFHWRIACPSPLSWIAATPKPPCITTKEEDFQPSRSFASSAHCKFGIGVLVRALLHNFLADRGGPWVRWLRVQGLVDELGGSEIWQWRRIGLEWEFQYGMCSMINHRTYLSLDHGTSKGWCSVHPRHDRKS